MGKFTVHVFKLNVKKNVLPGEFHSLRDATIAARLILGVDDIDMLNAWQGDSLNEYALGYSRKDDKKEMVSVEIRNPTWSKNAAKARKINRGVKA